jgi:hypothetical protein
VLTGGKKKWCDNCGSPVVRSRGGGNLSPSTKRSEHREWVLSEGMSSGGEVRACHAIYRAGP